MKILLFRIPSWDGEHVAQGLSREPKTLTSSKEQASQYTFGVKSQRMLYLGGYITRRKRWVTTSSHGGGQSVGDAQSLAPKIEIHA